jgi:hypothetical protein|tara:strand:- start:672 stop:1247 length:576 start_codon:yes stop_codon:yes gene_type:complete
MSKKIDYKKRLKLISEDIKRIFDNLPEEYMDLPVKGYEDIGTILSNIEIASDLKSMESINWKTKFKIPTHDPQTGELNPYYEELTGEKNPLTGEINTKYSPLRFDKEFLTKKQLDDLDDIEYVSKNIMKGLRVPPSDKDIDKMPNQKWHQIISFIKSGVRIIGYCFIPFNLIIATVLLVVSEVIGIIEEMV